MSVSENKKTESVSDSAPNAEGYLVDRVHSALELTCEKFVSSIKFSSFKKKYKAIYDVNPDALKTIYDQLTSQMHKNIHEDLDELCAEHSIDFLLTSLEKVNENQHSSQLSWRPTGNPEEDLRDHIYPLKVKHKEALENVLNKLVVGNEELVNLASVNHAEIMHIKKYNDDLHGEFSNIVASLKGASLENLQDDVEKLLEKQL